MYDEVKLPIAFDSPDTIATIQAISNCGIAIGDIVEVKYSKERGKLKSVKGQWLLIEGIYHPVHVSNVKLHITVINRIVTTFNLVEPPRQVVIQPRRSGKVFAAKVKSILKQIIGV